MASLANTEITNTFDVWRRNTNEVTDRLNSITTSGEDNRITLTGNVEVGGTSPNFEFVVDTTNNRVGIGTATPAVKLDVDGVTNISDDLKVGISGGGTANLIVDVSTNRVGINTNAPTEALDVTGKVLVSDDLMISGAASNVLFVDTSLTAVGINVDAPTAGSLEVSGNVVLQNSDSLRIKTSDGTLQTVLTANTSNSTILQGSGGTESIVLASSDGTSRITMTEAGVTAFSANVSIPDNKILSIGDFSDLIFYHDETNSYVQSTTGSLNIQTTFANSIVVEQGGAVTLYFSDAPNNAKLATTTLGVDITGSANVSNDLLVSATTNASNTLFVDVSAQFVGVNNDAPMQALDVIGNILSSATIEGPTITDGTATMNSGTISATAFTTGSFSGTTGTFSSLTDNRITFAGTLGLLEDSADLTFDGTTFEVGGGYGGAGVDIDMAGNISADGTITVDGLSSLDGGIDVNTSAFTVSSAGAVDTSSTLTVDGLSSLDGGIAVNATKFEVATDGAITTSNTLTVVGSSSLGGGIDVNGAFVVATDGGVTISDTLDVTDITTLSANLVVNTNVLFVDTANNRVGINTSTPQHAFDVVGDIDLSGVIQASGKSGNYYLKLNSDATAMEYVDIQAVLAGNGVVSKPLTAPFPNATGNERDVTMWQSNTVVTGNTNMLTYDLSTGQLNVKSNGTGSAILSIQDTGEGNNAELVKDGSDLKIRSDGGNIKFYGDDDTTNISNFQVYANNALQNIMHTGNGGPGTNFDADLLDGQQGSEYSRLVNTTSASTAGGYNEIIRWAADTNSDTAVVLTLLITSNRSDLDDYDGSCSALVQVSLVQNGTGSTPELESDIQLLSYSSYGNGSTEDIIEDILIASTGTTVGSTQSVYIKSKIINEVFTVQVLSESKTGSNVQDVTYPSSSWTTVPSNIQAQTGKIVRQSADFLPKRDSVYDLGSNTERWANIYADTFTGTLNNTLTLNTSGTGLTGSTTYNNSGAATFTVTSNATDTDTNGAIVARNASTGGFSAGPITADSFTASTGSITLNGTGRIQGIDTVTASTDAANKAYVDAQDLDFAGDTGGALSVNLDSQTFTIAGGEGIDTSGSGQTLTVAVDLTELTDMTAAAVAADELILLDGGSLGVQRRKPFSEIDIGIFNTTNQIALQTDTTGNYVNSITGGNGISSTGATTGENISHTLSVDLTDTNIFASDGTVSRAVVLDGSGNFSAGTITASLSGTATNATNFNVAADNATAAEHYVIFTGGATGNQRPNSDTALTYNPSTNTLTTGNVNITTTSGLLFNGTAVTSTAAELNVLDGIPATLTATELGYVDGVTSAIQTQLNAKVESLGDLSVTSTATELNVLDGIPATLTATELGYVDGVTSAIQTQLNAKVESLGDLGVTATAAELNKLDTATVTAAELNLLDGSSAGTIVNSKAVIYSSGGDIKVNDIELSTQLFHSGDTNNYFQFNTDEQIFVTDGVTRVTINGEGLRVNSGAAYADAVVSTASGSVSIDLDTGNHFHVTLTGTSSRVINNPTNADAGKIGTIRLQRNGTTTMGNITFGSLWRFPNSAVPDIDGDLNAGGSGAWGYLDYYADGVYIRGSWSGYLT